MLSLIVPAYNEAKRIQPFLLSIQQYISAHPHDIREVIVVDDGSTDSTAEVVSIAAKQLPTLHLHKHKKNEGKGAAVQTGIYAATQQFIVFMDADGATPISQLPKMMRALQTHDIAIGNRWLKGAKTERHSALRQLAGFIYRKYMSLFGLGAIDTMCGFKGYRAVVAKKLFADLQEKRWLFDTEIAYKAIQAGYTVKNFPITWESKDGSKLDTKTLIKSAIQIYPLIHKLQQKQHNIPGS